jgi:TRAP-type mannitol/chloroaromatic compound transport system substrate-binding protein
MLSGGRLTVKLYGASELVPAFQSFDAVAAGDADLYHAAEYYWQGKSKGYNFMTAAQQALAMALIECSLLFGGRFRLVFCFPFGIRHAVHNFAGIFVA